MGEPHNCCPRTSQVEESCQGPSSLLKVYLKKEKRKKVGRYLRGLCGGGGGLALRQQPSLQEPPRGRRPGLRVVLRPGVRLRRYARYQD